MSDTKSATIRQPESGNLVMHAADGRPLLTIHPDGTVTGEIEDAGEAARQFVKALRILTAPMAERDALANEVQRAEDQANNLAGDAAVLERENTELREREHTVLRSHEEVCGRFEVVLAERDTLAASLDAVRDARSNHPTCDRHGDGPVSCGWKSTVLDIDAALTADPSTILRERDAQIWDEAVSAQRMESPASEADLPLNPYRAAELREEGRTDG